MNKVTKKETGTDVVKSNLADALMALSSTMSNESPLHYLKFTNGEWLYGKGGSETLEEDEVMKVNPASFIAGYMGWREGQPIIGPSELASQLLASPLPTLAEARNDYGPEQEVMLGMHFESKEGGEEFQYHTTTKGGTQFVAELMRETSLGIMKHGDDSYPMVTLSGDKYKNKTHGSIVHTPKFIIVGWVNSEGVTL